MAARIFISYSHKDEDLRDELEVHLAHLRNQGLVEIWQDRRLLPGDDFDRTIREEINTADIILLLISPDFLASSYCFGTEMMRALERHSNGEARAIAVILRPCEWKQTDMSRYLATPTDGRPVTRWPDMDEAFLDVTQSIRRAIENLGKNNRRTSRPTPEESMEEVFGVRSSLPRSSNLRLKKEFNQVDKDDFVHEAFEYMGRYFQGSLSELESRNDGVKTRFRKNGDAFSAIIYVNGNNASACTIRVGGMFGTGISFSYGENSSVGHSNENISVGNDDQKLFLKAMGMQSFGRGNQDSTLSREGAAEYYWSLLIDRLQ